MKTRNFKKVLSMVLVLMMVISTMAILPMTASAEDEPAPVVLKGAGTEENPYRIGTAEELAALKAEADANWENKALYVDIVADIALESTTLGNGYYASDNTLDDVKWHINGNGYTLSLTQPLFSSNRGGTVIKNLNINANMQAANASQGGFVGYFNGVEGNLLIENCTISGTVKAIRNANDRHVGGFVAAVSGAGKVELVDCVNNATVTGDGNVGGMVGAYEGSGALIIANCVNNGTITGRRASGFVGKLQSTAAGNSIVHSVNKGAVSNGEYTDIMNAGSFVGCVSGDTTVMNIKKSYTTDAAAIVGTPEVSTNVVPADCFDATNYDLAANADAIAAINAFVAEPLYFTVSTFEDLAALKAASAQMLPGTRLNVEFLADITIPEAQASSFRMNDSIYAGDANAKLRWNIDGNGYTITGLTRSLFRGLNGHAAGGTITIKNLNLNSQITDDRERYVGGFVTSAYAPFVIENCTMNGTVTNQIDSGASIVGGIVGYLIEWDGFVMRNCVNNATVSMPVSDTNDNMHAGGLVGKMGHWDGGSIAHVIENCVNNGTVTGGRNVGGIVGNVNPEGDATAYAGVVVNCINKAAVSSTSANANVGAIVGSTKATGTLENKSLLVDGCYTNVADLALVGGYNDIAVPVTTTNSYTATEAADTANADAIAAINATFHTDHVYVDECAEQCYFCNAHRTATGTHDYTNACDADCNKCAEKRVPAAHVYANACDTTCNVCEAVREVPAHVYTNNCDTTCNECQAERQVPAHVYDNDCDVYCNECFAERATEHVYDNACDTKCNVCDEERTTEHTYDNACDAKCNVCDAERTPAAHKYTDDADTTCDVCGATRTVETKPAETTTTAPAADDAAAAPKGCGGAMNSTYAIIALVAVLGFAFVAKKREEN